MLRDAAGEEFAVLLILVGVVVAEARAILGEDSEWHGALAGHQCAQSRCVAVRLDAEVAAHVAGAGAEHAGYELRDAHHRGAADAPAPVQHGA